MLFQSRNTHFWLKCFEEADVESTLMMNQTLWLIAIFKKKFLDRFGKWKQHSSIFFVETSFFYPVESMKVKDKQ